MCQSAGDRLAVAALSPRCMVNTEVKCDFCEALVEMDEPCCALCGSPAIHTRIRLMLDSNLDDGIVREASGLVEDALLELNSVLALRSSHAAKVHQMNAQLTTARAKEAELQGVARKLRERLEALEDAESAAAVVEGIKGTDTECSDLQRANQQLLADLKKIAARLLRRDGSAVGSAEVLASKFESFQHERAAVSERLSVAESRVADLIAEAADAGARLRLRRTELGELERSVAGAEEAAADLRGSTIRCGRMEALVTERDRLQRRNDAPRSRYEEFSEAAAPLLHELHSSEQRLVAAKAKSEAVKNEIAALFLEVTERQRKIDQNGSGLGLEATAQLEAGVAKLVHAPSRPLAGELPSAAPVLRSAAAAKGVAVFGPPRRRSLDAQSPRPN